jgi:hypothetical protein
MTLCILHLGSEKTGTSSIQRYFGAHRDALLKKGFWYPRAFTNPGGHVHLRLSTAALKGALEDGAPGIAEFRSEHAQAISAGAKTAVFSSEFFHSELREAEAIGRLRMFLGQFFERFLLVYYARRQDQMLASMHSTAVKGAWTADPNALSVYESKGRYYFDHLAVCDLWARQFGRGTLLCRVYERDKLVNGDIIDDFSDAIGLDIEPARSRMASNESLSLEAMSALLMINGSKHRDNKELRRKIIAMGKERNGKRVPMITKSGARQFLSKFDDSNKKFFATYIDPASAGGFSNDFGGLPDDMPMMSAEAILEFIFGEKPLDDGTHSFR